MGWENWQFFSSAFLKIPGQFLVPLAFMKRSQYRVFLTLRPWLTLWTVKSQQSWSKDKGFPISVGNSEQKHWLYHRRALDLHPHSTTSCVPWSDYRILSQLGFPKTWWLGWSHSRIHADMLVHPGCGPHFLLLLHSECGHRGWTAEASICTEQLYVLKCRVAPEF